VQQQTRTIPIVITGAGEVTGALVKNIARPEGNITGITNLFVSIGSKWLELLKPNLARVGYLYNAQFILGMGGGYYPSIEQGAGKLAVKTINIPYRDAVFTGCWPERSSQRSGGNEH
jgi:putative ABC transport system substrate-binding protein